MLTVIALVHITGCNTQKQIQPSTSGAKLSSPAGMAKYLEDVPAVVSTEKWTNRYAQGLTINTAHYKIHTTLLDPLMLRQVPAYMEAAYKGYQSQLSKPIQTQTPFVIYLFDTRGQWEKYTTEAAGKNAPLYLKIPKGAYYLNGACVTYNIGRTRTFSVLGHEGWHQFNSRHFTFRLPSWLDEGIATLFENGDKQNNQFVFFPERNLSRLASLKKTLIRNNMIPLKELISLNPGEIVSEYDHDSVLAFYCQSYALVRFLREDEYGKRLQRYHTMLLDAVDGKWPLNDKQKELAGDRNIPITTYWNRYVSPKLFRYYITNDIARIEDEYINFCKKITYRISLSR